MAVFTVMADIVEGGKFQLHNTACKNAREALARYNMCNERGMKNVRIYRETQEITPGELRDAAHSDPSKA